MVMISPGGSAPLAKTLAQRGRSCERVVPVTEQLSFQELLPLKSVEAGEAAPQDQGVDLVRALIGVDRLQVQHVADDRELERNAAGAMDGTRHTGDVERLGYAVFLGHAHLIGGQ